MSFAVPVTSVRLRSHAVDKSRADAYFDNQNVSFADGTVRQFFCDVSGSFPKPEVSVWIGDHELTSQFNKTDRLVFEGPTTLKGVQVTTLPFINPLLFFLCGTHAGTGQERSDDTDRTRPVLLCFSFKGSRFAVQCIMTP